MPFHANTHLDVWAVVVPVVKRAAGQSTRAANILFIFLNLFPIAICLPIVQRFGNADKWWYHRAKTPELLLSDTNLRAQTDMMHTLTAPGSLQPTLEKRGASSWHGHWSSEPQARSMPFSVSPQLAMGTQR